MLATLWRPGEEVSRGSVIPPAAPSCLFSKDNMKRSNGGKGRSAVRAQMAISRDCIFQTCIFQIDSLLCSVSSCVFFVHHKGNACGRSCRTVFGTVKIW